MGAHSLHGKTCLITGATSGIGEEMAFQLSRAGARVIVGCRTRARGERARQQLLARGATRPVELLVADLASLSAVRDAAARVVSRYEHLHLLINNAGVYHPGTVRSLTQDGLEATFAINHLAHFLLTERLCDLLVASAPARIVTVASEGHRDVSWDPSDLQGQHEYDGDVAYDRSKLANVLFTQELARRLAGTRVSATCVHPGEFWTDLFRHCDARQRHAIYADTIAPADRMELMMRVATDPTLDGVSGRYFVDDTSDDLSERDTESAQHLWKLSEELIEEIWRSADA